METLTETQLEIVYQINLAVAKLGGDHELQAIVGSFGSTMDDDTTLLMIKDYNEHGTAIKIMLCSVWDEDNPIANHTGTAKHIVCGEDDEQIH